MAKTLTIQLPEDLELKLTAQAKKLNLSLESLVLHSLEQSVSQLELDQDDPLLRLIGSIHIEGIHDLGENHDQYIGQALYRELHPDE